MGTWSVFCIFESTHILHALCYTQLVKHICHTRGQAGRRGKNRVFLGGSLLKEKKNAPQVDWFVFIGVVEFFPQFCYFFNHTSSFQNLLRGLSQNVSQQKSKKKLRGLYQYNFCFLFFAQKKTVAFLQLMENSFFTNDIFFSIPKLEKNNVCCF